MIAELLMLGGAALTLISAIGVVRFRDVLVQMHALTKASTIGLGFVALGAALLLPTANDITSAIAAAALYIGTLPIGASLLGRATVLTTNRAPGHVRRTGEAPPD